MSHKNPGFYVTKTIESDWSREMLLNVIDFFTGITVRYNELGRRKLSFEAKFAKIGVSRWRSI